MHVGPPPKSSGLLGHLRYLIVSEVANEVLEGRALHNSAEAEKHMRKSSSEKLFVCARSKGKKSGEKLHTPSGFGQKTF